MLFSLAAFSERSSHNALEAKKLKSLNCMDSSKEHIETTSNAMKPCCDLHQGGANLHSLLMHFDMLLPEEDSANNIHWFKKALE